MSSAARSRRPNDEANRPAESSRLLEQWHEDCDGLDGQVFEMQDDFRNKLQAGLQAQDEAQPISDTPPLDFVWASLAPVLSIILEHSPSWTRTNFRRAMEQKHDDFVSQFQRGDERSQELTALYCPALALVLWLYTLEIPPIYRLMNGALNDVQNRLDESGRLSQSLMVWLPFVNLLMFALHKLPDRYIWRGSAFRGVKWVYMPQRHNVNQWFYTGKCVEFYSFKSAARAASVPLESEAFMGRKGLRTLFEVEAPCFAYDISSFSKYGTDEQEVLFDPLSSFKTTYSQQRVVVNRANRLDKTNSFHTGPHDRVVLRRRDTPRTLAGVWLRGQCENVQCSQIICLETSCDGAVDLPTVWIQCPTCQNFGCVQTAYIAGCEWRLTVDAGVPSNWQKSDETINCNEYTNTSNLVLETRRHKLVFVGPPGVGKTTFINGTARKRLANAGVSRAGRGVTERLEVYGHGNTIYMDVPGLDDLELFRTAAQAISEALRSGGSFQVIFMVAGESAGSARMLTRGELNTIKLVLEACDDLGTDMFGIIVNKCPQRVLRQVDQQEWIQNLSAHMRENNCPTTQHVHFAPRLRQLDEADDDDVVPILASDTTAFIQTIPRVNVNGPAVRDVNDLSLEDHRRRYDEAQSILAVKNASERLLRRLNSEARDHQNPEARDHRGEPIDSYSQFANILLVGETVLNEWIAECTPHVNAATAGFDDFDRKRRSDLQQFKVDIFGSAFIQRQMRLLHEISPCSDALESWKRCPHGGCHMLWLNEGGCEERRCGFSNDIDFENKNARHGSWSDPKPEFSHQPRAYDTQPCGRPFDWLTARPVAQADFDEFFAFQDGDPGKAGLPEIPVNPGVFQNMMNRARATAGRAYRWLVSNEAPF